eukprot:12460260-Alexandrium_andersonii.AAC.1
MFVSIPAWTASFALILTTSCPCSRSARSVMAPGSPKFCLIRSVRRSTSVRCTRNAAIYCSIPALRSRAQTVPPSGTTTHAHCLRKSGRPSSPRIP